MVRNCPNYRAYHYRVRKHRSPEKLDTDLVEEQMCTSARHIREIYGIPRSAVHFLSNPLQSEQHNQKLLKCQCYEIKRVHES